MTNEMTTDNMSNEEVIEVLKGIVFGGFDRTTLKERQALDLAIKALEERPPKYFPPCEDCNKKMEEIRQAYDKMKAMERPHDKWIPVRYRPLTTEERIAFAEHYGIEYCDTLDEKAFDCPMPEDRQEILISTSWGVVEDVADNDIDGEGFICYGLEINGDWDGVDAWMPKPERYKKEGADNDE